MPESSSDKKQKREERLAKRACKVKSFFSETCALSSENVSEYKALHRTLKSSRSQADVMQQFRKKLIADNIWFHQRAGRLIAGAIEGARMEALTKLLELQSGDQFDDEQKSLIATSYFKSDSKDHRKAVKLVEDLQITSSMIEAYAFELQNSTIMTLDKMRARLEQSVDQQEKKLIKSAPSKSKAKKVSGSADGLSLNEKKMSISSIVDNKDSWN